MAQSKQFPGTFLDPGASLQDQGAGNPDADSLASPPRDRETKILRAVS
jgi:hypothetical protein